MTMLNTRISAPQSIAFFRGTSAQARAAWAHAAWAGAFSGGERDNIRVFWGSTAARLTASMHRMIKIFCRLDAGSQELLSVYSFHLSS